RLLTGSHFVDRQELPDADARAGQPAGQRLEIRDLADPPASRRRAGKERNDEAGAPLGHHAGVDDVQAKCRSTRAIPSSNSASGVSRLTTIKDSRGKSKKNPGCTRTPASGISSNRTASCSSDSYDGTCITPDHPPSAASTLHEGFDATTARSVAALRRTPPATSSRTPTPRPRKSAAASWAGVGGERYVAATNSRRRRAPATRPSRPDTAIHPSFACGRPMDSDSPPSANANPSRRSAARPARADAPGSIS